MLMTRRRTLLALASAGIPCLIADARPSRDLCWNDLPLRAQRLALDLGLSESNWSSWIENQRQLLQQRIASGSAEHVGHFLTFARPLMSAPEFLRRAPTSSRHALVRKLFGDIEREWTIERCLEHASAFLDANRDIEARDRIYRNRGLSSDSSAQANPLLGRLPAANPARILIVGPGLDLTRREPFDVSAPLVSHQLEAMQRRYPRASITCVDIRPEVIETLHAARLDVTTQVLESGTFDLIVATNLLLYFEDRELLTALAGFAKMLAPSGLLLHNDTRFAAKVFGDALAIPVERYDAVQWDARRWDRAVIHRKVSAL